MLFNKTLGYALQTVIFLSNHQSKKPVLQKDIASALDIPHHYLGKILQPLTKNKIVDSKTGAYGGFYLAKPAKDIVLFDIVKIFKGPDFFNNCVLGFPGCDDKTPCPVHKEWRSAKEIVKRFMKENTVAECGADIGPKLDYIKILRAEHNSK
ncbi:MAG: Rrf2 family transcriptional regulator [Candidatus Neomarinimicrobiota bacterium]